MEVLCKQAPGTLSLEYQTAISPNVKNFVVDDNNEMVATVEVMWARLGFAFGCLQNCSYSLGDLNKQVNVNMEKFSDNLKHCLHFVSMAGTKMGKLNYLKKYLLGIFGNGNHKYAAVCELNFHILEAVMLMIEVSYTSLFLLKNQEFYDMCGPLTLWCENWYVKMYQPERDRTQEQVDYDLMVIGQAVLQKLDVQTNYFGTLCRAKQRNTILYHVMNMTDKNHVFSHTIKRTAYDTFEQKEGTSTSDNIRAHFAGECKLKREEISDCCN